MTSVTPVTYVLYVYPLYSRRQACDSVGKFSDQKLQYQHNLSVFLYYYLRNCISNFRLHSNHGVSEGREKQQRKQKYNYIFTVLRHYADQ